MLTFAIVVCFQLNLIAEFIAGVPCTDTFISEPQKPTQSENPSMREIAKNFASTSKRALVYILRANRAKTKFCEHLKILKDHSIPLNFTIPTDSCSDFWACSFKIPNFSDDNQHSAVSNLTVNPCKP